MEVYPIITCEHAGKEVPPAFSHLFTGVDDVLQSHRGWDPGALEIGRLIAEKLNVPFFKCDTTRLLVEPNRSMGSASLFSEYSKILDLAKRDEILNSYYHPHRNSVEAWIRNAPGNVLHLSIHSFTPIWEGKERPTDIGLLFDPARKGETDFCERYRLELEKIFPNLTIDFNEPYKGVDDGFTSYLRTFFPDLNYMGIEIEVNQKLVSQTGIRNGLAAGVEAVIGIDR